MLTPKENYLRCLRGEVPEWVPQFTMGMPLKPGEPPPDMILEPGIVNEHRMRGGGGREGSAARDPLADAYAVLGAKPTDDVESLRRRYRELAKKNHPDAMRAQGLPEEMVGKATERMSRINAAWEAIKEARGI